MINHCWIHLKPITQITLSNSNETLSKDDVFFMLQLNHNWRMII